MKRKWIPSIRFTNYHKTFPKSGGRNSIWKKWFSVTKTWGGNMTHVRIRHYEITFDYRKDWIEDLVP